MRRAARKLLREQPARGPAKPRAKQRPCRLRSGGAGRTQPRAALVRGLARGDRLDDAVVAQVRALVAAREHASAQAVATSLRAQPETETLGRVTSGIVAFKRGYRALAWEELRGRFT